MTHEIKNVLAVIRESSGLMEDILSMTKEKSFQHKEKFLKVLSTIQEQVQRGVDLATSLNRFAHSMDEPKASVDINATLDQLAFLMQRFARLKRVNLKASRGDSISIVKDPFRLQLVIFQCIESCLKESEEGMVIELKAEKQKNGVIVRILSCGEMKEGKKEESPVNDWKGSFLDLQEIFDELKITIQRIDGPKERGFELTVFSDL